MLRLSRRLAQPRALTPARCDHTFSVGRAPAMHPAIVDLDRDDAGGSCLLFPATGDGLDAGLLRANQRGNEAGGVCVRPLLPPQAPEHRGKLAVILDLDETLLFARNGPLWIRPGAHELLAVVAARCEPLVWTAGTAPYCSDILHALDPKHRLVRHAVARHKRWFADPYSYHKPLPLLGRPMDDVLLVDNSPAVMRSHPQNCLLVPDYMGGPEDAAAAFLPHDDAPSLATVRHPERSRAAEREALREKERDMAASATAGDEEDLLPCFEDLRDHARAAPSSNKAATNRQAVLGAVCDVVEELATAKAAAPAMDVVTLLSISPRVRRNPRIGCFELV